MVLSLLIVLLAIVLIIEEFGFKLAMAFFKEIHPRIDGGFRRATAVVVSALIDLFLKTECEV